MRKENEEGREGNEGWSRSYMKEIRKKEKDGGGEIMRREKEERSMRTRREKEDDRQK